MTMNEIQEMLTTMLRGIDKKTGLAVTMRQQPPGVTVRLSHGKRNGTLEVSEATLIACKEDLRHRNQLRTALKRARDRMFEEEEYIFSTKMVRQKLEGANFFRPMQGGGRGRR